MQFLKCKINYANTSKKYLCTYIKFTVSINKNSLSKCYENYKNKYIKTKIYI